MVDHYAIDLEWERNIRPSVCKIMVIDDLADRPHDCDLLLDQNLYSEMGSRYQGLLPPECQTLLGPKFSLLRPEFLSRRRQLSHRNGHVQRILVFYGGNDLTNETEKALQAINRTELDQVHVDVVVGAGNPHRTRIEKLCKSMKIVDFYCQVDNMAELMSVADLALCAGGTTTWERCSLGLPSIVTSVAPNQEELSIFGAETGLFFYLGNASTVSLDKLVCALKALETSPEALRCYSMRCMEMVDALGTQRVVGTLMPPDIEIRRATLEDCDSVYEWRNAEETRRHIFDSKLIPLESHRIWFRKSLESQSRVILIGEIEKKPVGVLRYDFSISEALISVYLVPGGQARGIGTELIRRRFQMAERKQTQHQGY